MYTDELRPDLVEIISKLKTEVYIIQDLMSHPKTYKKKLEEMYDYLKQGFEFTELRKCPVRFKFLSENKKEYNLELRHFVTNLMFWEPIMELDAVEEMDESYIIDCTKISSKSIKEYIDNKIIIPFGKKVSNKDMNICIHDLIYNLSRISTDFNIILGLSMNVETFIDVAERNKKFDDIIRTQLDENMQPQEIEQTLDHLMREQIKILINDENNFLKPILKSGTGIKHKQLAEFSISGGLKPDLAGNTIPIPINSNFIVGGLNSVSNYYIDSLAGRKSAIMTKTVMGRSGHFARMVMLLCSGINLKKGDSPCSSLNPIEYDIKTSEHLIRLRGRYYRLHEETEYKILSGREKNLIGRKILVKGAPTCTSKKGICRQCYGELYHTNRNITIGAYAGAKITEPVSQNVLSSKHLLTTISEVIEFNPEFYKYFAITANEIVPNNMNDDIDLNDYSILIINENIVTINEFDESDFNTFINILHVKNKKTGEIVEIKENTGKELFISPELSEMLGKDRGNKDIYEIDFAKIDDDMKLFAIEIENNELTKPLYNIMNLLNRSDHVGCTNINEMCQKMIDLLIESNIDVDVIHGELLIYPLLRSQKDILKRPNFKEYIKEEDYQILTVESALEKHPSVLIGLSFQALGRQLVNPLTFKKSEGSFIDSFFKEKP